MIIFFWQNCISPHQMPYIRCVANDVRVEKVYLIAPRVDYDERKVMGWHSDVLMNGLNFEIYIKPEKGQIDRLMQIEQERAIHLFSGIRGDHEVFQYFLQSRQYKLRRGFIIEPPYTYDKPLWAHYVRFFLQDRKFIPDFEFVFAIGENAVNYYHNWSKKWKVIPFIYCTEQPTIVWPEVLKDKNRPLSLVFVGNLSKRKNVKILLKALNSLPENLKVTLNIYGDGEQRKMLEKLARRLGNNVYVSFYGNIQMEQVTGIMQCYDVLILPSFYDGWGAVVNEALMCGLYVICSSQCGAKLLLKSPVNGTVFKNNDSRNLGEIILDCCQRKNEIRQSRDKRQKWSNCIDGESIARYMVDNLENKKLIAPPW